MPRRAGLPQEDVLVMGVVEGSSVAVLRGGQPGVWLAERVGGLEFGTPLTEVEFLDVKVGG